MITPLTRVEPVSGAQKGRGELLKDLDGDKHYSFFLSQSHRTLVPSHMTYYVTESQDIDTKSQNLAKNINSTSS
jgi:hypothetical protein